MNIYSRKQQWKIILLAAAVAIFIASLWYSSSIVSHVRKGEERKVTLWGEAIEIKAQIVYTTNQQFAKLHESFNQNQEAINQLREKERKEVKIWAKATKELGKDLNDYTFAIELVQDNKNIPVILIDDQGKYSSSLNLEQQNDSLLIVSIDEHQKRQRSKNLPGASLDTYDKLEASFQDTIQKYISAWSAKNAPIEITVIGDKVNKVYYKDSRLISELQFRKDSLGAKYKSDSLALQYKIDSLTNNFSKYITDNSSIPVVFTDSTQTKVIATNLTKEEIGSPKKLRARAELMKQEKKPIKVQLSDKEVGYIYYEDSYMLNQLKFFPYIQFAIIGLFLFIAYLMFSTFRKAEQNQVWVGMAKETAHQLGTPLSSLMAWVELLKAKGVDEKSIEELNKDVKRLETITDRFSKIGSDSKLESECVESTVNGVIDYLKPRVSRKVEFDVTTELKGIKARLNVPLFEWVIENLTKNAIDAMGGSGKISVNIQDMGSQVYIDITDTGKGIPSSKYKTVFEPGYTTKQRGWGLGLSLVKRIVENYHKGKIFVKRSETNVGTTFRIVLKK
jgi:hypothetical protein